MKAKNPSIIFDPYEFSPPFGESKVEINFKNGNLELSIYSSESEEQFMQTVLFNNVVYYLHQSLPGVTLSKIKYPKYDDFEKLVEFEFSEAKDAWRKHFGNLFKFRHFRIVFLSENQSLEIIAENFEIIV